MLTAIALPIPRPAPVTNATRPSPAGASWLSCIVILLHLAGRAARRPGQRSAASLPADCYTGRQPARQLRASSAAEGSIAQDVGRWHAPGRGSQPLTSQTW